MRVNDPSGRDASIAGPSRSAATEPSGKASGATNSRATESTDQVQLSNLGARISAAQDDSPEREAKLERLSKLVADGTYEVNASAISKAIVDESIKDLR